MTRLTRRGVLAGSAAMAAGFVRVQVRAAAEPQKITPALIEAAKKEGKLSWYTSVDLPVAEKIAKAFEAAYPGVSMKVERSGAERIFQRIGQEYQSKIYNCDVVNSSDAAHLIIWKRESMLASFLPEEVAQVFSQGALGSRRHVRLVARHAFADRLQHQPGEGRGGAQGLQRSSRSQMVGQDRQGASGLQRHHHDGDPAAQPRSRLVLFREARQAEGHAGPVGRRSAEEGLGAASAR